MISWHLFLDLGSVFQDLLKDYLTYSLKKGIPTLFTNLKPLYGDQTKVCLCIWPFLQVLSSKWETLEDALECKCCGVFLAYMSALFIFIVYFWKAFKTLIIRWNAFEKHDFWELSVLCCSEVVLFLRTA